MYALDKEAHRWLRLTPRGGVRRCGVKTYQILMKCTGRSSVALLTVYVNFINHLAQLVGCRVHAERLHYCSQLVCCNLPVAVDVE